MENLSDKRHNKLWSNDNKGHEMHKIDSEKSAKAERLGRKKRALKKNI